MKKIINLRFPLICAISLAIGAFCAYCLVRFSVHIGWSLTISAIISAVGTLFFLAEKRVKLLSVALCIFIFNVIGNALCYSRIVAHFGTEFEDGKYYEIQATVVDIDDVDYSVRIILDDVYTIYERIDGKTCMYLEHYKAEDIKVGDKISFGANITKYDTFAYGKLNGKVIDGIKYATKGEENIKIVHGFNLFGTINSLIKDVVFNADTHTASVVFAMLTGDTTLMEEGTVQSFRYGGIAHVFAVSGLHVGLIYSALTTLFKKLKLNKKLSCAIICALLIFYCGVCGFTASSVRATVMCVILSLSKLIYDKYDMLNALSIATIILLCLNPLYLFGVGFQLSVLAVLSINLFAPNFKRILKFLPDKVAGAIAVCLSAQVGTLPVLVCSFGYVSVASLFINLLILPVLSALFVVAFAGVLIALLLPFLASAITYACFLPLETIISFFVALGFENTLIGGVDGLLFIPLYFLPLALFTDKINLRPVAKTISTAVATAIFVLYVTAQLFVPVGCATITVCATHGGGAIVIKDSRATTVVLTDDVDVGNLYSLLSKRGAHAPDYIVVLGNHKCIEKCLAFGVDAPTYYLPPANAPVNPFNDRTLNYQSEFACGESSFCYVDRNTLDAVVAGASVRITCDVVGEGQSDLLITKHHAFYYTAKNFAYFGETGQKFSVYNCGDLRFFINSAKLLLTTPVF